MTQLLRTAEVSAQTGIPVATLRWWRHVGEGPPSFRLGRKNVVYAVDELDRWISRQQQASRGDFA
jgi:prophage regulatory protein